MAPLADKMKKALKNIVVSVLQKAGFKGSFPHFRRLSDKQIDLLTFQFDKWGGGFVIEISKCPPEGITTHWNKHISPNRVKAWDMHPELRLRLGPKASSRLEWFRFDSCDQSIDGYEEVAKSVLPFIESQAKLWWKKAVPKLSGKALKENKGLNRKYKPI